MKATDWPALLELANAAVEHVPGAGSQEPWIHNRRHFDHSGGAQRQFVAELAGSALLAGYCAVESFGDGEFRLFIVARPDGLASVGELLYMRGVEVLRELGARRVWFTEYAADEPLLAFAVALGFQEIRRFVLPEGAEAITLKKELDA